MITGKNYIGKEQSAQGQKTFKTINPKLNLENKPIFYEANNNEIDKAVRLAAEAFKSFRLTSGSERAEFLRAIADEIMALGDALITTYCSESGLPEGRAKGERGRMIGQLQLFANIVGEGSWVDATIDTALPDREPSPRSDIRKMKIPIGPVAVFGASNFPFAFSTAGGDTASALAAGCPVIVKSHPMHAGTGELISSAIIRAADSTRMPDGVFSNLNSSGIDVGQQLVQHPEIKAVGFTGSIGGGRALYDLAAKRSEPIPVFAEMGSINPVVMLPEALRQRSTSLAKTYANSITLGTGQFCTNPGLILGLKSPALSDFIEKLSEEIMSIEPSCMLHPKIKDAYDKGRSKALSQSDLETVAMYESEVLTNHAKQTITTVHGATFLKNSQLHDEVFGPYSLVVQCADERQLETIISQLDGQLTGTLIAEENELKAHTALIEALKNRVGRLLFNGVPTGVEVCEAMVHGGPYPASTDSRFTAVGHGAIERWVRPFCYQDWPDQLLPDALKNGNPLGIQRIINGTRSDKKI